MLPQSTKSLGKVSSCRLDFEFDSIQDVLVSVLDGVLSFVVIFAILGIGLRITEWLIRRGVERRKYLMRGWNYQDSDEMRTESITRVLLTGATGDLGYPGDYFGV